MYTEQQLEKTKSYLMKTFQKLYREPQVAFSKTYTLCFTKVDSFFFRTSSLSLSYNLLLKQQITPVYCLLPVVLSLTERTAISPGSFIKT